MYKEFQVGKRILALSNSARLNWRESRRYKRHNYMQWIWWKFSVMYQWEYGCQACKDTHEDCQECCPHDDMDHYICSDCGYEKCPGEDIDAAEYILDPDR